MRFNSYITELFVTRIDGPRNRSYEIFMNPDKKELKDAFSDLGCRFIIDTIKKDIYVFAADVLHNSAAVKLGIKYGEIDNHYLLGGTEEMNQKSFWIDPEYINFEEFKERLDLDWTKLFFGNLAVNEIKKKIKRFQQGYR